MGNKKDREKRELENAAEKLAAELNLLQLQIRELNLKIQLQMLELRTKRPDLFKDKEFQELSNSIIPPTNQSERNIVDNSGNQIGIKDFLIRSNVFRCMHESHTLKTVTASVAILDNNGNETSVNINAGYCEECGVYFMLESVYNNLRKQGIPLCKVSDEKTFKKISKANGMNLASESVLMQYGYNVSQTDGLSSQTRKKILAVLMDKKIISKNEIISYLDFFISQRRNQPKFEIAISKWKEDRDFVAKYKTRDYETIDVQSIKRK